MNTQTHILLGAVLFGRGIPQRAWLGALGGLLPDMPLIVTVIVLKIAGMPSQRIFGEVYFSEWCQALNGFSHGFILWVGLVAIFALLWRRQRLRVRSGQGDKVLQSNSELWPGLTAMASSGLLHALIDFLCYREDAHRHFWPVSNWIFVSPVSYYDPRHFWVQFALFEALLGVLLAGFLFWRFRNLWVRLLLGLSIFTYVAIPLIFLFLARGHGLTEVP